jgi:hypothetical protein
MENGSEEFKQCVETAMERITQTPERHAIVHKDVRRLLVRRFPYAIFNGVPVLLVIGTLGCRAQLASVGRPGRMPRPG